MSDRDTTPSPGPARARLLRAGARGAWWGFALGLMVIAPRATLAQTDNESCLTCHGDRSITRSTDNTSVHVDPGPLAASAHRALACVRCHADAREIPHQPNLAEVRCASCHGAAADSVARSVHGASVSGPKAGRNACAGCHGSAHAVQPAAGAKVQACASCHGSETEEFRAGAHGRARQQGNLEAADCARCHGGAHSILAHTNPAAPTSRARLAGTCGECHSDRQLMVRRRIPIPEAVALYEKSVHGRSDRLDAATCNDCHESHRVLPAADPASSVYRTAIPTTCGTCHAREALSYSIGVHGQALRDGNTKTPVCTDCHGEHLIRGPNDPTSPVQASAVTATCAHCHEALGIRETYGLPSGRLSTYEDSFHGLAARGGSPAVANCASCHGYHDILPSSDPRSMVSPQRLPETCGSCHPGAGPRFAMGTVHVAMAAPAHPALNTVRWIYILLILGTIGGMAAHQGLDFFSKLRRHWRRESGAGVGPEAEHATPAAHQWPARWHLRMTLFERTQHVLLAVSFFALVYTGFALKFPETWLFAWFARIEHGYALRSNLHRIAAVVMVAVSLVHVGYLLTRRGRGVLVAMLPGIRDAKEAIANVLYMAGLRRTRPDFDRFTYVEKAEYWALIWGTAVMTLTGFMLWFENQSLQWFDKWVLDLATIVHYYEAWLAFLAIVVWHLYQNIVNPDVYPMNWTWLTGKISDELLRHEHPAEWERVSAEERTAKPAGGNEASAEPDPAASTPAAPPADPGAEPPASR